MIIPDINLQILINQIHYQNPKIIFQYLID